MKKLIYNLLMCVGAIIFMFCGIWSGCGALAICSQIWGEDEIANPLHPALWLGIVLMIPSMIIGFIGGVRLCCLLQSYAEWKFNDGDKTNFESWLQNLTK